MTLIISFGEQTRNLQWGEWDGTVRTLEGERVKEKKKRSACWWCTQHEAECIERYCENINPCVENWSWWWEVSSALFRCICLYIILYSAFLVYWMLCLAHIFLLHLEQQSYTVVSSGIGYSITTSNMLFVCMKTVNKHTHKYTSESVQQVSNQPPQPLDMIASTEKWLVIIHCMHLNFTLFKIISSAAQLCDSMRWELLLKPMPFVQ